VESAQASIANRPDDFDVSCDCPEQVNLIDEKPGPTVKAGNPD
jgi:hypothetical protein